MSTDIDRVLLNSTYNNTYGKKFYIEAGHVIIILIDYINIDYIYKIM